MTYSNEQYQQVVKMLADADDECRRLANQLADVQAELDAEARVWKSESESWHQEIARLQAVADAARQAADLLIAFKTEHSTYMANLIYGLLDGRPVIGALPETECDHNDWRPKLSGWVCGTCSKFRGTDPAPAVPASAQRSVEFDVEGEPVVAAPTVPYVGVVDGWADPAPANDPEPQPSDGPEFHADHDAWEQRQADPAPADALPDGWEVFDGVLHHSVPVSEEHHAAAAPAPADEGGVIVLGPGVFAKPDGSVLNWNGVNYVPQPDPDKMEGLAAAALAWRHARIGDALALQDALIAAVDALADPAPADDIARQVAALPEASRRDAEALVGRYRRDVEQRRAEADPAPADETHIFTGATVYAACDVCGERIIHQGHTREEFGPDNPFVLADPAPAECEWAGTPAWSQNCDHNPCLPDATVTSAEWEQSKRIVAERLAAPAPADDPDREWWAKLTDPAAPAAPGADPTLTECLACHADGWGCTLPAGHTGEHLAVDLEGHLCARWADPAPANRGSLRAQIKARLQQVEYYRPTRLGRHDELVERTIDAAFAVLLPDPAPADERGE